MSSYDSFMFPEFLPIGLVGRPYGGVKTEPPDVKAEEDLPRRFMFGCLQKGSFRKTESRWWASYRHPTREISAEVAYDGTLEVNFSWQGEKWMAISPGQTFTDIHLCIYPKSLDVAMKERLEQRYNLALPAGLDDQMDEKDDEITHPGMVSNPKKTVIFGPFQ